MKTTIMKTTTRFAKKMITNLLVAVLIMSIGAPAQEKIEPPIPDTGNVTLTLVEYNRLLELAGKPVKKPEPPPLAYVLKRADLKLRVAEQSVRGSVQFEGEVLNKGVSKVPLLNGMTVFDASQQGKALPLEQEGGTQTALLPGPAEFSIMLDAGLPLSIEAGRASFYLPVPSAGSSELTLVVPGDRTNVKISPGLITRRTSDGNRTTVAATLVPGQPASISWATREVAEPAIPREVRFLSDVKTLASVGETDFRIAALADLTVVQGEPAQFELVLPGGYEATGVTGSSLDSYDMQPGVLLIKVSNPAQHNHQFLISLERKLDSTKTDVPFLSFKNAQRETGEALVEGVGAMELTATEGGGLKRIDLKEVSPYLRSLARHPLQGAFRYHRQPTENPTLAREWTRFEDSGVLAAVAERAVVTTLVTSEGKSLTEVKLVLKNQAQPFLKVMLPAGANIVTAEVAGEEVKPAEASDGSRMVPLLRMGFRPTGSYTVSFVFMHSGSPFANKGGSDLTLPRMDIPISLLQWEVFLPARYQVKNFGGDALSTGQLPPMPEEMASTEEDDKTLEQAGAWKVNGNINIDTLLPGQIGGYILDASEAVVPNAQVTVADAETGTEIKTMTDQSGRWLASNVPSGNLKITADSAGFRRYAQSFSYDASRPSHFNFSLQVGATAETIQTSTSEVAQVNSRRIERQAKQQAEQLDNAASANVFSLQKRVAGVLPVRVDVPRAGNSYRFVRPLVLGEETKLTFSYKTKG